MVLLYIALGSALGGVARYLLAFAVQHRMGAGFPFGTLVVNVSGCLAIGLVIRLALDSTLISTQTRIFLTTGFCGGFTTFSTFSYETVALIQNGAWRRAVLYVTLSVTLSLAATFAGFALADRIAPRSASLRS